MINLINDEILLFESFLNENPNQARKFLKEKNLDPITNPNGQKIFNTITGITRGDGYTYLLTRFYVNEKMPVDDLKKLHEYLRQNKEFVTRLEYNQEYYDRLNQKSPVSKRIKIPLTKLTNYIGQHELFESIKKLVLEESYDIKLNYITEEIQNLIEGIQVYHGSNNKFQDFDMDKVGSSGKSLGGWGIYFSDDENVSKRYSTKNGFVKPFEIRNGEYFDLDQPIYDGHRIIKGLQRLGIDDSELEQFQTDYIDYDATNRQAYEWLTYVLGGEKQASEFLMGLGYIGNTMMDKWETNARNYIVFDVKNIL
jgi:hypothetical protein